MSEGEGNFWWEKVGWTDADRREAALDRVIDKMGRVVGPDSLTEGELRIVRAISYGLGDQGTADLYGIGYETVRSHVVNARRKVAAKNVAHLVAIALREGLIE